MLKSLLRWSPVIATVLLTACGPTEPVTKGGPIGMRALTDDQYGTIIADVFGSSITVAGHFDPLTRTDGLLQVGAGTAEISPAGFERDKSRARSIAEQVVDERHRDVLVPCKPQAADAPDDACAKQFYARVGRLLFRRSLSDEEVRTRVALANATAKKTGSFYAGLESGLTAMLLAPDFLYVTDIAVPDRGQPAVGHLDGFSKASRLSFLLWNTTPDDELLTAAEKGELDSTSGLARQLDRMIASPRLEAGMRAFFSDMFGFDDFDALSKDGLLFPAFSQAAAAAAKEQTLRTVVDLLITHHGDYRDIFTTRKTFMSSPLALIYGVPVTVPGGWVPYQFADGDPHAGILSQVSFVALHSHPGMSSPTLRGRALRELLLCQKIPDPPANVSFVLFNDPNSPHKTARDRLTAHRSNPVCAGCHKLVDPIGLTLENFDSAGAYRTTENGVDIDASGELDGVKFTGAEALGQMMHDNPAATSCVVNRIYAYAAGRAADTDHREWIGYLEKSFAADGYKFPELLRRIALSDAFYAVALPGGNSVPVKAAEKTGTQLENKS